MLLALYFVCFVVFVVSFVLESYDFQQAQHLQNHTTGSEQALGNVGKLTVMRGWLHPNKVGSSTPQLLTIYILEVPLTQGTATLSPDNTFHNSSTLV